MTLSVSDTGPSVFPRGEGGGMGVLAQSFGTHYEMDPESGGSDKQRQKGGDQVFQVQSLHYRFPFWGAVH